MTPHATLSKLEVDRVTDAARLGHPLKFKDIGDSRVGYVGYGTILFSSGSVSSFMPLWSEALELWRKERDKVAL